MNKQVILLMSGMGVPDEAFFALQEAMLKHLGDILINEEVAANALSQVNLK